MKYWQMSAVLISALMAAQAMAADCKKADVVKLVDDACKMIEKDGTKAFSELVKPQFKGACGSYVWVHEVKGPESIVMTFHPANPLLNSNEMIAVKDPMGKLIFKPFIKVAAKKGQSGWVEYNWPKPNEQTASPKCSYVKGCDGKYSAGMGIYGKCKDIGVDKFE